VKVVRIIGGYRLQQDHAGDDRIPLLGLFLLSS
jgi:hypothetical protein